MYEVLDASMTNQVEIFYPGEEIYGECKSKGCIMELGKMLNVNSVSYTHLPLPTNREV